jgi:hypothetical protein
MSLALWSICHDAPLAKREEEWVARQMDFTGFFKVTGPA